MIVVDAAAVVDALTVAPGTEGLRARLGEDALTDFEDLPIHRWPASDAMRRRAYGLRDNVSAYDAAYIALAETLACPLVTRDAALARSPGHGARIEVH